ncbi:MAG: RDD family protein [Chloroflexi bacterium]|nr:RDD family protein [Chloroflexota bacterium]
MSSYDFEKPKNGRSYVYETEELAGLGERLIALIIDGVILGIIGGVLFSGLREGTLSSIITFLIGITYNWYFLTQQNGQTIGKRVMGIRVVKINDRPLETADVIVRYVGYYINSFLFGLGWIWAAFDNRKQGWHDKLASTLVVKA